MSKIIIVSKLEKDSITLSKILTEDISSAKIILLSDAVFLLKNKEFINELNSGLSRQKLFYALEEDIKKRNINSSLINIIDYDNLIDILMEPNSSIINL
ncbi:MAG: DsrH/TusB family sulfur metabolism protein [Candidatus Hodarchaeales archaeon]